MNTVLDNQYGMGWLADNPDFRDYTEETPEVAGLLSKTALKSGKHAAKERGIVDLRPKCPPDRDQGALGSCTANACVGLVEYMEKQTCGRHIDA